MNTPVPPAPAASLPDTLANKLYEILAETRGARAEASAAHRIGAANAQHLQTLRTDFDHHRGEQTAINRGLRELLSRYGISLHEVKSRADWAVAVVKARGPAVAVTTLLSTGILVLLRLLGIT